MGLTDRSRLNSLRRKQERIQRKLETQKLNPLSASALESAKLASEPAKELSPQDKAWKKYLHAKAIYEETKQVEHWQYMQQCISDYEKTLRLTLGIKA
jgi:hypothetical protein